VEYATDDEAVVVPEIRVDVMAGDEFRLPIARSARAAETDREPSEESLENVVSRSAGSAEVVNDAVGNAQCVDSVMSEWDVSDWWTAEESNSGDSPSAAAALGILAAAGTLSKSNRRRKE
jgi:hypothetical protein